MNARRFIGKSLGNPQARTIGNPSTAAGGGYARSAVSISSFANGAEREISVKPLCEPKPHTKQ
jgi:hypothetical protein